MLMYKPGLFAAAFILANSAFWTTQNASAAPSTNAPAVLDQSVIDLEAHFRPFRHCHRGPLGQRFCHGGFRPCRLVPRRICLRTFPPRCFTRFVRICAPILR